MVRIAGINVPDKKHVKIALTSIYGIGIKRALNVCKCLNIKPNIPLKDLSEEDIILIRKNIGTNVIEGDLRRRVAMDIKRLRDLRNYRGMRHIRGLPTRGQKTKNNAKTCKKNRKHYS